MREAEERRQSSKDGRDVRRWRAGAFEEGGMTGQWQQQRREEEEEEGIRGGHECTVCQKRHQSQHKHQPIPQ